MKAALTAALTLALTVPAIAHPVGFRNPVAEVQVSEPACIAAMVAAQTYDAFNSAHRWREGGHETDPTYRPFSHGGAKTMLLGFAVTDAAMLLAAHAFHIKRTEAERYMAEQSVAGILTTNDQRF